MVKRLVSEKTELKLNQLHHNMGNLKVHLAHAKTDEEITCALKQVIVSAKRALEACENELERIQNKNQPSLFK